MSERKKGLRMIEKVALTGLATFIIGVVGVGYSISKSQSLDQEFRNKHTNLVHYQGLRQAMNIAREYESDLMNIVAEHPSYEGLAARLNEFELKKIPFEAALDSLETSIAHDSTLVRDQKQYAQRKSCTDHYTDYSFATLLAGMLLAMGAPLIDLARKEGKGENSSGGQYETHK
ncbi:MAG: hypothetical protein V1743_00885 [Nanoarchaeota archaeon]